MNRHGCCTARTLLALCCCLALQAGCGSQPESGPSPASDSDSAEESARPRDPLPVDPSGSDVGVDTGNPERQPAQDPPELDWPGGLSELVSSDPAVRGAAAERFAVAPPDLASVLEMWAGGTDRERQGAGFFLLGMYQGEQPDIESSAIDLLGDPDPQVRRLALGLLKQFGAAAREQHQLELLLTGLLLVAQEPDAGNRANVARMLASQGRISKTTLDLLFQVTRQDPSAQVRQAALYASSRLASSDELLGLLENVMDQEQDAGVKRIAVTRIGRLGAEAKRLIPRLGAALNVMDEELSDAAAKVLAGMGELALPELVKQLQSNSPHTRKLAIFSLASIGTAARPAVPALQERLKDQDEQVRQLAEMAIRAILLGQ